MSVIKKADVKSYFSERRRRNLLPFHGSGQKLTTASPNAQLPETSAPSVGSDGKANPSARQK
jgi:hypothetical protein